MTEKHVAAWRCSLCSWLMFPGQRSGEALKKDEKK